MNAKKLIEAEIVDVLTGNAGDALEHRVHDAVRSDLSAAEAYAEWAAVIEPARDAAVPVRAMGLRVNEKVMARLAEQRETEPEVPTPPGVGSFVQPRRLRLRPAMAIAACLAAFACLALAATLLWMPDRAKVLMVSGEVFVVDDAAATTTAVEPDARLRIPVHLRTGDDGRIVLTLPKGTTISAEPGTGLYITNSRLVRQPAGTARYQVTRRKPSWPDFTVAVPQGSIVDLGTEFEVIVKDEGAAAARVMSGRVRVIPNRGSAVETREGERAILTPTRAVKEPSDGEISMPSLPGKNGEDTRPPDEQRAAFTPEIKTLAMDAPLAALVRARSLELAPGRAMPVTKTPPFTSPRPMTGVVRMRDGSRDVEAAVVCDEKLSGREHTYFDANADGDLTNDPVFEESEDFVPGKYFGAGMLGRNDALWLKRPIRLNTQVSPPVVEPIKERLDLMNRRYLAADVDIQLDEASQASATYRFLLVDTDSDGDYGDEGGALGVWAASGDGSGPETVLALGPVEAPLNFAGYRWNLTRDLSGGYELLGERLNKGGGRPLLKVGDKLPEVPVTTLAGERRTLKPPSQGFLLIYVWSTWFSACQRDVPYDFNELYPKFGSRGLEMVGISTDHREEDLLEYVTANKMQFPQVFNGADLAGGVTGELGIAQSPQAILVDPAGTIVSTGQSAEELWSFLDASLPDIGG